MVEFFAMPEIALRCRNHLGECVLWDETSGRLIWVDIHVGKIFSWNPFDDGEPETLEVGERIGAIALRECGGLVLGLERRFAFLDPDFRMTADSVRLDDMPPTVRLNDGRTDPTGRFLCGGMDEAVPQGHIAALYALGPDRGVSKVLDGIACTNSLCWSPDGATLYFTDMPNAAIEAFDYDVVTGAVSNRRLFADLAAEPGLADGSCVDAEGYLWNAQWGGKKVVRYAPDGRVDREIELPVTNPTCLTFGGPDLDVLFVTSARFGLGDTELAGEQHAGDLIALRPGVKGRLEYRFKG